MHFVRPDQPEELVQLPQLGIVTLAASCRIEEDNVIVRESLDRIAILVGREVGLGIGQRPGGRRQRI